MLPTKKTMKKRMMKRTLAFTAAFAMLFPAVASAASQATTDQVRSLLSKYHVSGVTADQLQGKSIPEMLELIGDPYTNYYTQEEYEAFIDSLENTFVGIGVRIGQDDGGLYIVEVFKGSPAENAGVKRGDYIRAVNGESVEALSVQDAVNRILGEEGTKVAVSLLRDGNPVNVEITRAEVHLPIVESHAFADDGGAVGYIRLTTFSDQSDELFAEALQSIRNANPNLQALVIDLRYNGGGYVNSAKNIASEFIQNGVFLHLKDRDGADDPLTIANGKTFGKPVYILMNEYSASASEILAGALRDEADAKLIGTKSFGKGSMQVPLGLDDDSVLKLTTEEYLTPKYGKVNKVGLKPDDAVYTDMAQLIAGLHAAGVDAVQVETDGHVYSVNGFEVGDSFFTLQSGGQTYLPSRLLAELIDADIAWNGDAWAVEVTKAGKKETFRIEDGIAQMRGNSSFINAAAFAKAFPSFTWSSKGKSLTLLSKESSKEN